MLSLSLLRRPLIAAATLRGFAIGAGVIGLAAFIPTYLEVGAGSPLVAGLALQP